MPIKRKSNALKQKVTTLFLAFKHKEAPLIVKILTGITVAYVLSPIDLIPETIPVVGYADDLIILPILLSVIIKLIPRTIREKCEKESAEIWNDKKTKKWYYALPIIMIGLLILIIIICKIIN